MIAVEEAVPLAGLDVTVEALLEATAHTRWIRRPAAHAAIIELASSYGLLIDSREWPIFGSLFADPVQIDLSSVNGSSPAALSVAEYVETMTQNMIAFASTQHVFSNYIVRFPRGSANKAYGVFNGITYHMLHDEDGPQVLSMGVRYEAMFGRGLYGRAWHFQALRIQQLWQSGPWDRFRLADFGGGGGITGAASSPEHDVGRSRGAV